MSVFNTLPFPFALSASFFPLCLALFFFTNPLFISYCLYISNLNVFINFLLFFLKKYHLELNTWTYDVRLVILSII